MIVAVVVAGTDQQLRTSRVFRRRRGRPRNLGQLRSRHPSCLFQGGIGIVILIGTSGTAAVQKRLQHENAIDVGVVTAESDWRVWPFSGPSTARGAVTPWVPGKYLLSL